MLPGTHMHVHTHSSSVCTERARVSQLELSVLFHVFRAVAVTSKRRDTKHWMSQCHEEMNSETLFGGLREHPGHAAMGSHVHTCTCASAPERVHMDLGTEQTR